MHDEGERTLMARLGLYTRFNAKPGERARLVEQLLHAAGLAEGAPGCVIYIVNTGVEEDSVWVTEIWRSEEDHRASLAGEGVPDLIQETLPLLAGAPEQIRLVPIGGKGLP